MANNLLDAITSPLTGEYRKEKPLSVKAADTAVSLTTPIDSIAEIQAELQKDEPDYLKIGMLGGVEAISLIPGIAPAARTMIRKGADMARQTDEAIDVASSVPKVAKNKPEEFSGTIRLQHGYKGDKPTEFVPQGQYKGDRYDSDGGVFGGKPLYMEDPNNPAFLGDSQVIPFSYDDVVDVDASFDKAFVLTPDTVGSFNKLLKDIDTLDDSVGPQIVDKLEELGYDGLIIRGFPDPTTSPLGKLREEQSKALRGVGRDFEKGSSIVQEYAPKIEELRRAEGIDEMFQQPQVLALRPERQRVKSTRQVSNTEYDARVSALDSAEDAKTWQTNAEALVKDMRETSPTIRTPELEESAKALRDGKITREQHLKNINTYKPVESWDALPREPSNKATVFSLKPDQREKGRFILPADTTEALGVTQSGLKVGDRFNGRLDIPAYQRFDTWIVAGTSNAEKGVTHYAKAIHYKGVGDNPVRFAASQKKGEKIGTGEEGKTGYATVSGEIKDLDADAIRKKAEALLNDPEWTQVGFDPRRQSSFYVRGADNRHVPVREADEVIQIGPLVLAKNAKLDKDYAGYAEGGVAMDEQMNAVFKSTRGYALGGDVEVDPVSGNEVPPGSLPEEVRDDIPAMLSEGEYVVPADVLRYYGVKFFEDLRAQAKMGLAEMDANGRIGGEPIEEEAEDVGISDEDLMVIMAQAPQEEQTVGAANGGLMGFQDGGLNVPDFLQEEETGGLEYRSYVNAAGNTISIPFFNNEPMAVIPEGYSPAGEAVEEEVAPQAPQDDGFDAASAQRAREEIEKGREDKTIDFNNPQSVEGAVNTYYSSKPLLDLATTTGLGLIPGVAASYGIKQLEKNNLLKGINTAIDETDDTDIKEKLTAQKELLEDKDKWKKTYESKTEGLGLMDRFKDFFDFDLADTGKQYTRNPKEYSTDKDWAQGSLNKWVDATNLVNSVSPDDPKAWSEAIQAQAEASREATAAAQAASGWGTEDYTPSGPPEPTVFNSSNDENEK
jgi:hypothetical protein